MRRANGHYRVEIRHGTIHRFEVWGVRFAYPDSIANSASKSVFQQNEQCVLVARIAHGEAEARCFYSFIIYNGVLSVASGRKNGQRVGEGVGFKASAFHQCVLRIYRIVEWTVYRRACG